MAAIPKRAISSDRNYSEKCALNLLRPGIRTASTQTILYTLLNSTKHCATDLYNWILMQRSAHLETKAENTWVWVQDRAEKCKSYLTVIKGKEDPALIVSIPKSLNKGPQM